MTFKNIQKYNTYINPHQYWFDFNASVEILRTIYIRLLPRRAGIASILFSNFLLAKCATFMFKQVVYVLTFVVTFIHKAEIVRHGFLPTDNDDVGRRCLWAKLKTERSV